MPDQMLQPHYIKIYERDAHGYVPFDDGRRLPSGERLPIIYEDWFAANDEATKGAGRNELVQIFPYYPEYTERERAYRASLIEAEKSAWEKAVTDHETRLAKLIGSLAEVA